VRFFQDERAALSALRTIAASMEAEVKKFPSDPSVTLDSATRTNIGRAMKWSLAVLEELKRMDMNHIHGGWLFNTSFEGRLSQAPIVTAPNSTGSETTPDYGRLLQTPNAGVFELAAYAPWVRAANSWMFKNEDNALFVAPIVKAGLIAATGKHEGITMDARNNNYGYWNSGIRFGHIRLDAKPKQVAGVAKLPGFDGWKV
jgi:hypothetical protein